MTRQSELLAAAGTTALGAYRPPSLVLERGQGRHVYDLDGTAYLDLSGGVAVTSIGHGHPTLLNAISRQATRLMHASNLFTTEPAVRLAAELRRRTAFPRSFFVNSGTEANETLIKLARRHHFERGDFLRTTIVSSRTGYHGRTLGSLSLTGQARYRTGMEPMAGCVRHVPYNDLDALRAVVGADTAAVVLETIQAEAGIVEAGDGYLAGVRRICDAAGALLFLDEVQTGYGRTGRFLSHEWSGAVPDACSVAKGIAGGFPMGAVLAAERLAGGLPPGSHASTFGGNPLACAAALAVLEVFDHEKLVENAESAGRVLRGRLDHLVSDAGTPAAVAARGRGLLQGLELADGVDPDAVVAELRTRNVLITVVGGRVLRFSPALTITEAELTEGMTTVEKVLGDPPGKPGPR